MKKDLVSVVIPTLPKRKELLKRAIESVNAQTYKNIEIIPVIEGDNACEARNIGVNKAKGEFIAFLDDDDTWEPTKIEKQVKYIKSKPNIPIVICFSNDLRRKPSRISKPPQIVDHCTLIKGFNLSSTSSYLVRRSQLEQIKEGNKYFDENAPAGHEYDLALRMTKLPVEIRFVSDNVMVVEPPNIHCIQEVLMTQYKTPGQISENWGKKVRGQYFMMHKWGCEYGVVEYLKRIGLVGLFFMGFFIGDRVMYPINWMKQRFEE